MEHRVVVAGYEHAHASQIASVFEVFASADFNLRATGRPERYAVELRTADGRPFAATGGLVVQPVGTLTGVVGEVGTLIVPGAFGLPPDDPAFQHGLRHVADRVERIVALCTGAFAVGLLGELDGRRATTHWLYGDELAHRVPRAAIDADAMFVRDGRVSTSAGAMGAVDLLLALVQDDVGQDVALACARVMVVFLQRTGSQRQFSTKPPGPLRGDEPIRELQRRIADEPGADHSVDVLAARLHMSSRNFSRVFTSATGTTPGRYVEQVRIDTARRLLEETDVPVESIAGRLNMSAATLRRLFTTRLGVSPSGYRDRFRAQSDAFHVRIDR
jgi:transcriptional regulator GlxA family with amidase domain